MENVISAFRFQKNFSFRRLSNMISWIYCQSRLAILGCLIGGGLVFALIPSITSNANGFSMKYLFFMIVPVIVFIYFSKVLNNFITKSSGIQFLLLPATTLEKFLTEVFFIILPIPLWFILYHIGAGQVVSVNRIIIFNDTKSLIGMYVLMYLVASINFKSKQNNIVVGIVSMFVFFILFGSSPITNSIIGKWAHVEEYNKFSFNKFASARKGVFGLKIDYPIWIEEMKRWIFIMAYILLFIASYFKIKEKEIK